MINLNIVRNFIQNHTNFKLNQIYVGRYFDDKKDRLMLSIVQTNEQDITFGKSASYGETTLAIKYNGDENYATSIANVNSIFLAFKENMSDIYNKIILHQPQQPILIGKVKDIYKFEIIINIKFDY